MQIKNFTDRQTEIDRAKAIIAAAKGADRSLTDTEVKTLEGINAALDAWDEAYRKSPEWAAAQQAREAYDERLAGKSSSDPFAAFARTQNGNRKRFSGKAALRGAAKAIANPDGMGFKALAPSGNAVAPVGLISPEPVRLGQPANGLLTVIKTEVLDTPPLYDYLRQITRTNNAAPVASGGTKPTSTYALERKEDRLRVIAHLSEPVDKYWLADLPSLERFMADELGYGIELAVENQVLNGDGTGENMTGLANTSGIQAQAFSTDRFETLRKALTKLQNVGSTAPVIVLNPLDWEAMDLTRVTGTNEFLVGGARTTGDASPSGANPLLSWGVEVALSTSTAAGTSYVMDKDACTLLTDGQLVVEWDSATGFAKNQLIARCEGRFGLKVEKPLQVVKATIVGA